jgi:hypothetical protein
LIQEKKEKRSIVDEDWTHINRENLNAVTLPNYVTTIKRRWRGELREKRSIIDEDWTHINRERIPNECGYITLLCYDN